ncbi:RNB domain protein, partial [Vibrio parahaemolyticus V-223/04]
YQILRCKHQVTRAPSIRSRF